MIHCLAFPPFLSPPVRAFHCNQTASQRTWEFVVANHIGQSSGQKAEWSRMEKRSQGETKTPSEHRLNVLPARVPYVVGRQGSKQMGQPDWHELRKWHTQCAVGALRTNPNSEGAASVVFMGDLFELWMTKSFPVRKLAPEWGVGLAHTAGPWHSVAYEQFYTTSTSDNVDGSVLGWIKPKTIALCNYVWTQIDAWRLSKPQKWSNIPLS